VTESLNNDRIKSAFLAYKNTPPMNTGLKTYHTGALYLEGTGQIEEAIQPLKTGIHSRLVVAIDRKVLKAGKFTKLDWELI
jgi:hypothetical protein